MAANRSELDGPNDGRDRDKYRDGDDEARRPARTNVGRTARDTADAPTGPEGNDKMRNRDDA